jgi:hypothetical protein
VFRSTKGKSYIHIKNIIDNEDPEEERHIAVYIVTFQDGAYLRDKIQRICDSFTG